MKLKAYWEAMMSDKVIGYAPSFKSRLGAYPRQVINCRRFDLASIHQDNETSSIPGEWEDGYADP